MSYGYRQLYSLYKTEDIYVDIAKDIETRFDPSNHELERTLPRRKNKKVIRIMKDKLVWEITTVYRMETKNV